jgi:hypothetical protein
LPMTNESTVIERTHTRSPIHSFLGHGRPDRAPRPNRRGTELGTIFYLPPPLTRKARGGGISGRATAPRWHVLCRPRLTAARSAPLRPSAAAGGGPRPATRRSHLIGVDHVSRAAAAAAPAARRAGGMRRCALQLHHRTGLVPASLGEPRQGARAPDDGVQAAFKVQRPRTERPPAPAA